MALITYGIGDDPHLHIYHYKDNLHPLYGVHSKASLIALARHSPDHSSIIKAYEELQKVTGLTNITLYEVR